MPAEALRAPRRVSRKGVLGLCARLDGSPGRSEYARGRCRLVGEQEAVEILPPFPFALEASYDRLVTGPLREHLLAVRTVALVVVRLGGYGAAVYRDEQVIAARAGTRFVKGRHRKGGSSSGRFARRRGEQARDLHDRAAALADELIGPYAAGVDHLVLAGDRLALLAVLERSQLLRGLAGRELAVPFDVPEPRRATLDDLARELWSSTLSALPPGA